MQISNIIEVIEKVAPLDYAAAWDKSGVQVPSSRQYAEHVAVMLDPSIRNISAALGQGADFILTHHPLAIKPRFADKLDDYHEVLYLIFANQAWLYSAHSSLDANLFGPAAWLADELGLLGRRPLETTCVTPRVAYYLHGKKLEQLLLPTPNKSNTDLMPGQGNVELYPVAEGLVLACRAADWGRISAYIQEYSPGIVAVQLDNPAAQAKDYAGLGFIGALPKALPYEEFCVLFADASGLRQWAACGAMPKAVQHVACCPGSGSSLMGEAARLGADVFITGDTKYHAALEAQLRVLEVGHFSLEEEMTRRFALLLEKELPEIRVSFVSSQNPFVVECA